MLNFKIFKGFLHRLYRKQIKKQRSSRLKGTIAQNLDCGYIDSLELLELIKSDSGAGVIYDIGACIGTWSLLAKAIFPEATVHAFEPLSAHTEKFPEVTKGAPGIILHKVALGREPGRFSLKVTEPTHAASFMDITASCTEDYAVTMSREEMVDVEPLDSYVLRNELPLPNLIKLDVQGYELEVLRKGENCLRNAEWIICEVSFKEYYQRQPLFSEVISFMHERNFEVYAFGVNTPLGKSLHQIDVLFRQRLY